MPFRTFTGADSVPTAPVRVALCLRDHGPQCVASLTASTGLAQHEVMRALDELQSLEAIDVRSGTEGTTYAFRYGQGVVVAIDAGPTVVHRVVCDLGGHVLARTEQPWASFSPIAGRIEDLTAMVLDDLARAGVDRSLLWTVAIGVPARLGAPGRIVESPLVPSWTGVDLGGRLAEALDCAVHVANEFTLAAIAEAALDCGSLARDFLAVQVGHRIGLRQVLDGRPYEGVNGTAGSVVHLLGERVDERGRLLWRLEPDGERVITRALAGDVLAAAEVDDLVRGLAAVIARTILATNPETVIVGGSLGSLLGPWRQSLSEQVRAQLHGVQSQVVLHCSRLDGDAVVAGAALLALEEATHALLGEAVPAPLPNAWTTPRLAAVAG